MRMDKSAKFWRECVGEIHSNTFFTASDATQDFFGNEKKINNDKGNFFFGNIFHSALVSLEVKEEFSF